MEVLKFIIAILVIVILACFTICAVSAVMLTIRMVFDDLRWEREHRRK